MENKKLNIEKIVKQYGFKSIDDLKRQKIEKIDNFMDESGLSYFEVFFESEIEDIREALREDKIKLVRVRTGTKRPMDNDFFHKQLTMKEILSHTGNFGICVGYNHSRGESIACIDIDGLKLGKLSSAQKNLLSDEQVRLIENLTDERKNEIIQESKDYLLRCILGGLPSAMALKTQSGGYHIYVWNKNHLKNDLEDAFHYVSKRLSFPVDCPIKEIRGLSLLNSLEIFTKFKSKQCILAGSFIKNTEKKETYSYELIDTPENTKTFSELGTVTDVNESIKNHLMKMGFDWKDDPVEENVAEKKSPKNKTKTNEEILNPIGILKELTENEIDEVVDILLPIFKNKNLDGVAHYTVLALGGYFCRTITEKSGVEIIEKLLKQAKYPKESINEGIATLKNNYKRKGHKTGLNTAFANIQDKLGLTNEEKETLKFQLQNICYPTPNKTNKTEQDLMILIKQKLCLNKEPSIKILADYINMQDSFYIDYETGNKYKQTEKGFKEINIQDISIFLNHKFGENKIPIKKCEQILSYITNPLETDYNLIIFNNGTLNTNTGIFKESYYPKDCLPKIKTELNYVPDAELKFKETDLYSEFQEILKSERWDWNESLYYKCVGVSAMAINEADCFFIIVGVPNARKTTLLTPLKRFFSFSEVKLQTIAENGRFQILPCVGKDINIDDDLSDTTIKNSGFLKTFISGAGGNVERKGENIFAKLTPETTPILWGASNKLPTIHGEGMARRTCLLLAENPIDQSKANKNYQTRILNGERDKEIELMISYSIQQYIHSKNEPFLTEAQQSAMLKEWNWKSYPAKMGAHLVFMDTEAYMEYLHGLETENKVMNISYDEKFNEIQYEIFNQKNRIWENVEVKTWTTVRKANTEFKKFYKISLRNGKIFQETSKPSTKLISTAMSNAGFLQSRKNITNDTGNTEQVRIYEDCIINPEWKKQLINL